MLTDLTAELQQGCEKRRETVPKLPGSPPKVGAPQLRPAGLHLTRSETVPLEHG